MRKTKCQSATSNARPIEPGAQSACVKLSRQRDPRVYPASALSKGYAGAWSNSQQCWYAVSVDNRYWTDSDDSVRKSRGAKRGFQRWRVSDPAERFPASTDRSEVTSTNVPPIATATATAAAPAPALALALTRALGPIPASAGTLTPVPTTPSEPRDMETAEYVELFQNHGLTPYMCHIPPDGYYGDTCHTSPEDHCSARSDTKSCWYGMQESGASWREPGMGPIDSATIDLVHHLGSAMPPRGVEGIRALIDGRCTAARDDGGYDGATGPAFRGYSSTCTNVPGWLEAIFVEFASRTTASIERIAVHLDSACPFLGAYWVVEPCVAGGKHFLSARASISDAARGKEWPAFVRILKGMCEEMRWGLECLDGEEGDEGR